MQGRRERPRRTGLYIAAAAAAIVMLAANWLAEEAEHGLSLRADITRSQRTVLSGGAKSMLETLREDVYLYYVGPAAQDIITDRLLKNYDSASSHIRYSAIDKDALPEAWSSAGASAGSVVVSDSGAFAAGSGTFEVIAPGRLYSDESGSYIGERIITASIMYVAQGVVKRAVFVAAEGEQSPCPALLGDMKELHYETAFAAAEDPLDAASDTLIVISAAHDISDAGADNIAAFLEAGGKAAFFLGGSTLDIAVWNGGNSRKLLLAFGLEVGSGIIVGGDPSNTYLSPANIMPSPGAEAAGMGFGTPPPVMRFARPVTITQAAGAQAYPLLVTDESCFLKEPDAFGFEKQAGDARGSFITAAISLKGDSAVEVFTSASLVTNADDYSYRGNSQTFLRALELLGGETQRYPVQSAGAARADIAGAWPAMAAAAGLLPFAILAAGIARRRARRRQ